MRNNLFSTFFEKAGIFGINHLTPCILTGYFSEVPLLFSGPAGTGKTSVTEILGTCEEKKVEKIECAHITLEMLLGLPKPKDLNEDKLSWVGGLKTKKPDIVILDELSRTSPSVQGYLHEFVRTGMLGDTIIDCKRIATCNPPSVEMMTSFLDFALATRFSVVEFPKPSLKIFQQIIQKMQVEPVIPVECKAFIQRLLTNHKVASLEMRTKVAEIMNKVIPQLEQYNLNNRQVKNMMVLLLKAASFQEQEIHDYTNSDVSNLIASVVPSKLVKVSSIKDSNMKAIASTISSLLPKKPFIDDSKKDAGTFARTLEESKQKFRMNDYVDLIKDYLNSVGNPIDVSLRRLALLEKTIDKDEDLLQSIPWSTNWEVEFKAKLAAKYNI